jgi:hypothetical protein
MGSQFVDFNADGHLDYLSATFDGSPHISYGSKEGFSPPERLKDADGQRILISSFWNYEDKEHQKTGRSMADGKPRSERCISALAFDWDDDGDYDLLLGSYEKGHIYLQMNEGTKTDAKFTGKNIPVMAGEKPFGLPSKMTTPKLVDWDSDGDLDLIAGTFSDAYQSEGQGGGVYLSVNEGEVGAPKFGPVEELIAPVSLGGTEPQRPDLGLYPDPADHDGDGDLDLIVGGYSSWTPSPRELSGLEELRVEELTNELEVLEEEQTALYDAFSADLEEATAGLDSESEEYEERSDEVRDKHLGGLREMSDKMRAAQEELDELVPKPKRKSFVWLYERL